MKDRIIPGLIMLSFLVLIGLVIFTSPMEIGPLGVLLFFTTLYTAIFGLASFVMQIFYRLALKRDTFRGKDYLYSAVFAFGPIMLFMARTFNAINLWTIGLIISFVILAEFLVAKRI